MIIIIMTFAIYIIECDDHHPDNHHPDNHDDHQEVKQKQARAD